jgi:hypothetical protein
MKHLKRFNEDMDNHEQFFSEDLLDFCETNLVYLMDDDTKIQIVESPGGYADLHLIRILLDEPKRWNEIKDHIIPFLTRLDNKYEINNQPFKDTQSNRNSGLSQVEDIRLNISFDDDVYRNNNGSYMTGKVKNLIADNIGSPNARISDIRLYVKGYKNEKKSILTKIKSFFK